MPAGSCSFWWGPARTAAVLTTFGQHKAAQMLRAQQPGFVLPAIDGLLFGPPLPEERLHHVPCPALILTHPGDPEHPLRSGEVLSRIPGALLRVAPAPRYWRTHPETLAATIVAFLRCGPGEVPVLPAG